MNASPLANPEENELHQHLRPGEALRIAKQLPLTHRFHLGATLTPVQKMFLDLHGFIVFAQVASPEEVTSIQEEVDAIQVRFFAEGRRKAYGVPIWAGKDHNGEAYIQRFAFTSMYSDYIRAFVRDERFEPVRKLIGDNARVGDQEKDGVVFNRYIRAKGSLRPQLGWHTDGLRSLWYGRMPGPMMNVGLHFQRITEADGGLRLIPGSHTQGFFDMAFRKAYFLDHRPDPDEITVETWPGDLTVHDGRLWHRVAPSPHTGERSKRESMYVPYITDAYSPKSEDSKTLSYMRVFDALMKIKGRLG
jgi:ectoine hydroxylase-related dioxygenase (phytanoyl-CoA dioxygenase family)